MKRRERIIMIITKRLDTVIRTLIKGTGRDLEIELTQQVQDRINSLITNKNRCVCFYDSKDDYNYTINNTSSYLLIPLADVCGSIARFDLDTLEFDIDMDDKYFDETSDFYIPKERIDDSKLSARTLGKVEGTKFVINVFVGLDLIYSQNNKTAEDALNDATN